MKLEDAFKKYPDEMLLRRKKIVDEFKERFKDDPLHVKKFIESRCNAHDIGWLKGLHAWGNEESRKLGFIIPDFMIEDANADDWEIVEVINE